MFYSFIYWDLWNIVQFQMMLYNLRNPMCFIFCVSVQTRPALPALQQLIHSTDEEVVTDACWALSYLSDGTHDKIQAVIDSGVCSRLVELLQ